MKKRGIIILIFLFVIFIVGMYLYVYKSHRNIASEAINYSVSVKELKEDFNTNYTLSNKKYLDKIIEVKGKITNIDLPNNTIVLDNKLFAVFNDTIIHNLSLQNQIKIKGRFIGYDDMLDELKMDQVSISK